MILSSFSRSIFRRHSVGGNRGFALVVTLSLMILMTVIAVGLLSLSSISLRTTSSNSAQQQARSNARLALMLGLGELQKQAGPDQRISATADRSGDGANPAWTGIWHTDQPASAPTWLVSGEVSDPLPVLPAQSSVRLNPPISGNPQSKEIRVPLVNVTKPDGKGRYAWWIGDEGVKARVDLSKPTETPADILPRLGNSQSPLEPGLASLGSEFTNFGPGGSVSKTSLISLNTLSVATNNPELPKKYFTDLTTGGFGIPVNVAQGRLKTDLSLVFDRSQKGKTFIKDYLGASGDDGLPSQKFSISTPEKFYLSDSIRARAPGGIGPNWGILWNYARLWKNFSNQQIPVITSVPSLESDLRLNNWLPYTNSGAGSPSAQDIQHLNSPVTPVLSLLQIGFRLKAKLASAAVGTTPAKYQLQLQVKPVVGIWNPYNAPISGASYLIDWGIFPWFRYNSGDFNGVPFAMSGSANSGGEFWMRDQWKQTEKTGLTRFVMKTATVDLQPGEFRMFSVSASTNAAVTNTLESKWNEDGSYQFDILNSDGSKALVDATCPGGTRYVWIDDFLLDDMQNGKDTATRKRFPVLNKNTTNSYFDLKFGTTENLSRHADLWNTGNGALTSIPEQVDSPAAKTKSRITDLAIAGGQKHLATWAFHLRTTTEIEESNQRLRGWIDSNPRTLASNPRWDGSTVKGTTREGWNFTTEFMGGALNSGNRGLVAVGSDGNIEPQIGDIKRYQGLGGASTTSVGGQPNVMVYDVPRSALVSIGQFQHAQLSRYNFEPGFVLGNSYANLRIPLDATKATSFSGVSGLDVSDVSYEVNTRIWDDFYFSTLGLDYQALAGNTFDSLFKFKQVAFPLPNPRMVFTPESGDKSIDAVIADSADKSPQAISSRIRIEGAFNVNSTSKTAWKAVLSSMGASELPRVNLANPAAAASWEKPKGIRFNRFSHVASADSFMANGNGQDPAFWLGWRELNEKELDDLATEIVKEVKARGPFRSLAEFVNRNPSSSNVAHRQKGALQAAIDRTVNASLPSSVSDQPASKPPGPYSDAINGESQAAGHASYLMQGDILQSLAPILQVRSDYFRIRAYGEALDAKGGVIARAQCEAFVQREPSYIDPSDRPETENASLKSVPNVRFGRRFNLVSFRWLSSTEI